MRGRVAGVAKGSAIGAAVVLIAVACRPLSGPAIEALPIPAGLLVRSNAAGIAVGSVLTTGADGTRRRPARVNLADDSVQTLPDLGNGSFNVAGDINDAGVTVGFVFDHQIQAARWDPAHGDALELLPTLGGSASEAVAINQRGEIAGASTFDGSLGRAFTIDPTTDAVTDLGTLGGPTSLASDISDSGVVVGVSDLTGGGSRGFVYDPAVGSMQPLPAPPSPYDEPEIDAINPSGTLVAGDGVSSNTVNEGGKQGASIVAVIYDRRTGTTTTLDPFGGHRAIASDVNDRGIVVGYGWDTNGSSHAYAYDTETKLVVDLGTISGNVNYVGIDEQLRVVGYELAAGSPNPPTAFTTTLQTSPDAPAAPTVSGCDGSVRVAFAPPAFDGNDAVTGYTVQRDGETIATVSSDVRAIDEQVPIGTTASYAVIAANGLGLSDASPPARFTSAPCS
jgi:probable HAF family extracellular repeat protein